MDKGEGKKERDKKEKGREAGGGGSLVGEARDLREGILLCILILLFNLTSRIQKIQIRANSGSFHATQEIYIPVLLLQSPMFFLYFYKINGNVLAAKKRIGQL